MKKYYNQQTMQNSTSSSKTVKNDYCQYYVDKGKRPQNFIRDIEPWERFKDYPKLNELMRHKNNLLETRNHPPMFIKADINKYDISLLGKFDVILMDPPWNEYKERVKDLPINKSKEKLEGWKISEIASVDLNTISNTPSFLFLWVGSDHLDDGRTLMKYWGYKRCEDVVWLKTNKLSDKFDYGGNHYLQRVKEHCLVGVKGDVKRASDSHFIHANIDTDVIVAEEFEPGSTKKPQEIYDIIERFCLGRRRIEVFADNHSIRPGWLSIGRDLNCSNFDKKVYESWLVGKINHDGFKGGNYIGTNDIIDSLRPKSPKHSKKNFKVKIEPVDL